MEPINRRVLHGFCQKRVDSKRYSYCFQDHCIYWLLKSGSGAKLKLLLALYGVLVWSWMMGC